MCKDGFLDAVNDTCQDIDECYLLNQCDVKAECYNFPGSYLCECIDKFYGNGTTCLPGDCIQSDCPANEECVTPRRNDCRCKKGFHRDEFGRCIDTNECSMRNNCHHNATCSNTEGLRLAKNQRNNWFLIYVSNQ